MTTEFSPFCGLSIKRKSLLTLENLLYFWGILELDLGYLGTNFCMSGEFLQKNVGHPGSHLPRYIKSFEKFVQSLEINATLHLD